MAYYKVIFHLDGTGVYYDPNEPIHLDALMAWSLAPRQGLRDPQKDQEPPPVRLPIATSRIHGSLINHASALFPEGHTAESIWHWRKRFRQNRAELTTGSPNLTNGQYRDWQTPLPLLLTTRMVGYVHSKRKQLRRALGEIRYLGKKRAHGHGRIVGLDIEEAEADYSLLDAEGRAMRWLPDPNGTRRVRPQPPYWHPIGKVTCCEIGDWVEIGN